MSLSIKCPNCGEPAIVSDDSIFKGAKCNSCQARFFIKDAVVGKECDGSASSPSVDTDVSPNEKLFLRFGLGIPAVFFLSFLIYWFGVRDTWENDNYLRITEQCQTVDAAIAGKDDDAASQAYAELNNLLGDRTIQRQSLSLRIQKVRTAYLPVQKRLDEFRLEREARERLENARIEREARDPVASLREEALRRLDALNRNPYERGYSLEIRREAARRTLVQRGYSPSEAQLTVDAMEVQGLLPDPPRH